MALALSLTCSEQREGVEPGCHRRMRGPSPPAALGFAFSSFINAFKRMPQGPGKPAQGACVRSRVPCQALPGLHRPEC